MSGDISKVVFKVGDRVKLNSGGPDMTVVNVTVDNRKVKCTWHSHSKDGYQGAEFLVLCLTKVE